MRRGNKHDSAIWDWFIVKRVAALLVIFLAAPTLAFGQTSGSGAEGSQEPCFAS